MNKVILLFSYFVLLCPEVWGESAKIRIEGVKSLFASVVALDDENAGTISGSGDHVVEIRIEDADSCGLYCLGVNNKVCFFSLLPGKTVGVKADGEHFVFSGAGKERNQRLERLSRLYFYTLPNVWVNDYMSRLFCPDYLSVDSAVLCREAYVQDVTDLFTRCQAETGQWKEELPRFVQKWQKYLERDYWNGLTSVYRTIHYYRWPVPSSLLQKITEMPFQDTAYMLSQEGKVLTYNYLLVQEELQNFDFQPETYLLNKARCIPDPVIREEYILKELNRWVTNGEFLCLEESFRSSRKEIRSAEGKKRYQAIKKEFRKQLELDSLNDRTTAFVFENEKGRKVSSEQFRGKYVYLDIWATWCGPCKQEMPYMQELERNYEGGDVVFVSLSVDKIQDREKWLAYLEEHQIRGVCLMAPESFKNPFIRKYGVSGIPRFMLIGPDGKMISHNCWRPSDPRMKILLEKRIH